MAFVIKSIQQISITIAASSTSNTATISSVTTANAIIIFQGETTTETSGTAEEDVATYLALTNATTVTATRGASTNAVTVLATVVEFASGVNSIQAGTIALANVTSNTATITSVGANAFVLLLGASTTATSTASAKILASVVLTNSTTVTAAVGSAAGVGKTITVSYMVADLDTTVVSAIQAVSHTDATSATSYTDTITSVTTGNALLIFNGITSSAAALNNNEHTLQLTNATTVTLTRSGTATTSRTVKYTVVSFAAGALNGSVQRGTIALSSQTSNTATITSVSTAFAFCNYCGFQGAGAAPNAAFTDLTLTNATTVTAAVNSSASPTASYEVIQFAGAVVSSVVYRRTRSMMGTRVGSRQMAA